MVPSRIAGLSDAPGIGSVAVRIVVDRDLCESNAVCMGIEPTVFEVDDNDELQILNEHPDESLRPKMEEAVRRCPKQALSIED